MPPWAGLPTPLPDAHSLRAQQVQGFEWGSSIDKLVEDAPFDFVVGSDIIYHPHCLPQV